MSSRHQTNLLFLSVSSVFCMAGKVAHPSRRGEVYHRAALRADPLAAPQSLTEKAISIFGLFLIIEKYLVFLHDGLPSRPSTSSLLKCRQDVDARHKAGHDELRH